MQRVQAPSRRWGAVSLPEHRRQGKTSQSRSVLAEAGLAEHEVQAIIGQGPAKGHGNGILGHVRSLQQLHPMILLLLALLVASASVALLAYGVPAARAAMKPASAGANSPHQLYLRAQCYEPRRISCMRPHEINSRSILAFGESHDVNFHFVAALS